MTNPTAPTPGPYPDPPDIALSRVVIPPPAQPPLGLVLTCGSRACRYTFEPDPVAFAAGSLACPSCGGWVFGAELVEPVTAGVSCDA
ncbi:MAG: hypothetical protein ACRDSN_01125 [Pseudonocardiaceae bacterium]